MDETGSGLRSVVTSIVVESTASTRFFYRWKRSGRECMDCQITMRQRIAQKCETHFNIAQIRKRNSWFRRVTKYGLYVTRGAVSATGGDFAVCFHIHFVCGAYPTFWAVRVGSLFPRLELPIAKVTSDAYLAPKVREYTSLCITLRYTRMDE